jgi:LEA14-like dessication related protein
MRWSVLGAGLWLAGCASVFGDVEPPEVSLAGLAFDQPGLFEQRLRLDVRLRNPNDFQLDVERLLFDLEVNDRELGKGWTTASFDVPAFGEALLPVSLIVLPREGRYTPTCARLEAGSVARSFG